VVPVEKGFTIGSVGEGIVTIGLTPRLPMATEPKGIPVRATLLPVRFVVLFVGSFERLEVQAEALDIVAGPWARATPPPSNVLALELGAWLDDSGEQDGINVEELPGKGLTPVDESSVAPSGMPVGIVAPPVSGAVAVTPDIMPSGDVPGSDGDPVSEFIWANAGRLLNTVATRAICRGACRVENLSIEDVFELFISSAFATIGAMS
jgi:hypothetical protein